MHRKLSVTDGLDRCWNCRAQIRILMFSERSRRIPKCVRFEKRCDRAASAREPSCYINGAQKALQLEKAKEMKADDFVVLSSNFPLR